MGWFASRRRQSLTGGTGRRLGCLVLLILAMAPIDGALTRSGAAELLMFEEAGCSWCRRWDAEVGPGYPLSDEGRRAPLRRIDISRARSSGVILASPVTMTPTFVLVDAGAEVGRITGYPGADFFWGLVSEMIAKLPPEVAPRGPGRDARGIGDWPRHMARDRIAARGMSTQANVEK